MSGAEARPVGHRRIRSGLLALAAATGLLIYLFPYTWMVLTAFRRPVDTFAWPPRFVFEPTLAGFARLFEQTAFLSYVGNSLVVTTLAVCVTIAIALPAAYATAQVSRGKRRFLLIVLIARMIPPISLVVPIYLLGNLLRMRDTYQLLIAVNVAFNLPFAIWMLRSYFLDVPASLREAGLVDGASEWQIMTRIVLPIARGGITATAVFIFIAVWNEFLFALILTDTRAVTAPIAILSFRTTHGVEWDTISAAAFLVSLPVIVFAFVMQKYLVQGMTLGAVK